MIVTKNTFFAVKFCKIHEFDINFPCFFNQTT